MLKTTSKGNKSRLYSFDLVTHQTLKEKFKSKTTFEKSQLCLQEIGYARFTSEMRHDILLPHTSSGANNILDDDINSLQHLSVV